MIFKVVIIEFNKLTDWMTVLKTFILSVHGLFILFYFDLKRSMTLKGGDIFFLLLKPKLFKQNNILHALPPLFLSLNVHYCYKI